MTNFDKQWEAQARVARLEGEFYANFLTRYPNIKVIRVHDSTLFERKEDYLLFKDELEKFMQERRTHE